MELKKNNSHQNMDIENIIRRFRFGAFGLMAGLNFALFSGASVLPPLEAYALETAPNVDYNELTDFERLQSANLPRGIGVDVLNYLNEQRRKEGLSEIADVDSVIRRDLERSYRSGSISVNQHSKLTWLNDCKNLEKLVLNFKGDRASEALEKVNFENLGKLNELCVNIDSDEFTEGKKENTFNEENYGSFLNATSLRKITVLTSGNVKVDPGFFQQLSNMPNLEELTIKVGKESIDYRQFGIQSKLKHLTIFGKPGNIAMTITPKEFEDLQNRGIKVTTLNSRFVRRDISQRISEINEELDGIMNELNLYDEMSDEQKRNIIVLYIVNHLEYDPEVSSELKDSKNANSEENLTKRNKKFYKDGVLYGALESDTQICGNYAALFQALAERAGLESYYISADTHAFNLVGYTDEKGKKYYRFLDATFIDGIKEVRQRRVVCKTVKLEDGQGFKKVEVQEENTKTVENVLMDYMDNPENAERYIPYLSIKPEELKEYLGSSAKGTNIIPEGINLAFVDEDEHVGESSIGEQGMSSQGEESDDKSPSGRLVEVDTGDRKYLVPMGVLAGMFLAIELYKRKTKSREATLDVGLEDLIEF